MGVFSRGYLQPPIGIGFSEIRPMAIADNYLLTLYVIIIMMDSDDWATDMNAVVEFFF